MRTSRSTVGHHDRDHGLREAALRPPRPPALPLLRPAGRARDPGARLAAGCRTCRTARRLVITFPYPLNGAERRRAAPRARCRSGFDRLYRDGRIVALEEWTPAAEDTEIGGGRRPPGLPRRRNASACSIRSSSPSASAAAALDVWMPPDGHHAFSRRLECAACRIAYSAPLPSLFSFNSPIGACDACRGFGRTIGIDLDLIIPDRSRSLAEGAVKPFGRRGGRPHGVRRPGAAFCRQQKIPHGPALPGAHRRPAAARSSPARPSYYGIEGYFRWLENRTYKMHVRVFLSRYRSYDVCPALQRHPLQGRGPALPPGRASPSPRSTR
ncbi:MAG: hypothetical protein MZV70_55665 [Desulfobacterales bacterium]|nr:hypothetical protein [Desulfobacterales bacterium]